MIVSRAQSSACQSYHGGPNETACMNLGHLSKKQSRALKRAHTSHIKVGAQKQELAGIHASYEAKQSCCGTRKEAFRQASNAINQLCIIIA